MVDEDGKLVTKAGVGVLYNGRPDPPYSPVNGPKTHVFFEKQTDQLLRSSQLAPNVEFEVYAAKDGLESERITKSMKEGTDEVLTLTLTKSGKKAGGETEMKEDKDKN